MIHSEAVSVIGGGGHGKVIVRLLQDLGYQVTEVFDDDETKWGRTLAGVPIVGRASESLSARRAVIAVGDNAARRTFVQRLPWEWLTLIHPHTFVDATVRLGAGCVVLPGAIIQVDSVIGAHSIINTASSVDHDCMLGDYVHVAPGVHLTGGCVADEGVFLGAGTVTRPGVTIGSWTTVGAGASVVRDLPSHAVAMGVPARVARLKAA